MTPGSEFVPFTWSHFEVEEDVVPDVVDAAGDRGPGHGADGYSLLVPVTGGLRWLLGGGGHLLYLLRAAREANPSSAPSSRAGTQTSRSRKTLAGPGQTQAGQRAQAAPKPNSHRSHSPLSRSAKDRGTLACVANPYSEGEESDTEDRDYTVVGLEEGGESLAGSEADTLVPGAVQHVHQTGYPSTRRVKQNKVV